LFILFIFSSCGREVEGKKKKKKRYLPQLVIPLNYTNIIKLNCPSKNWWWQATNKAGHHHRQGYTFPLLSW
jgi:hypothetical protein